MLDIEIDDESAPPRPGSESEQATRTIRASSGDENLLAIMRKIHETLDERVRSGEKT